MPDWSLEHPRASRALTYGASALFPALAVKRRFIIYATGRSGTQVLTDLLDSHPDVRCAGELLTDKARWPERLLHGRAVIARRRRVQAYGVKVLRYQLFSPGREVVDPPVFLRLLVEHGYDILHVHRRNVLLQALSSMHAEATSYHFKAGAGATFQPLTVDPVEVIYRAFHFEAEARQAREDVAGVPHTAISYEDDLVSPEAQSRTLALLVDLLGLRPRPVASDLVRVAPGTVAGRVANYDELAAAVASTRLRQYLDDTDGS